VNDLQRALRHIDLNELADIVDQSYQQGVELTGLPSKQPKTADNGDQPAAAEDSPPP